MAIQYCDTVEAAIDGVNETIDDNDQHGSCSHYGLVFWRRNGYRTVAHRPYLFRLAREFRGLNLEIVPSRHVIYFYMV